MWWRGGGGEAGMCPPLKVSLISYTTQKEPFSPGPLGLTCDPSLHHDYPCYSSCGDCSNVEGSCDWTSCHDDVVYTETVLYDISSRFCVDMDSVHMSGASNGGMFLWTRALSRMSGSVGTLAPVCSSPLRGYNSMPENPVNIIGTVHKYFPLNCHIPKFQ